jgi:hypothetical protein
MDAPVGKVQHTRALTLAHPHASTAQYTFILIKGKERMAGVQRIINIDFFQPFIIQFEVLQPSYMLKLAFPILGTVATIQSVVA